MSYLMREITAVELRQGLGKVARRLEREGEPVLLKLGRRPVGVIVSIKDFNERFALQAATEKRKELVEEILAHRRKPWLSVERALDEVRRR
jgi:hypothetical protein